MSTTYSRILSCVLLLLALGIVAWIHTLPRAIAAASRFADLRVREQIAARLVSEMRSRPPSAEARPQGPFDVEQWIARNPAQFRAAVAEEAARIKAQRRFTGEDGREYHYFGGLDADAYLWLRRARTYLRRGTTCEATHNGACRDLLTLAPFGRDMLYRRSVHIAAIVAVHRVATFFDERHPLPASAALVPMVASLIAVFPAFALGRRLAGPVGGFAAVVLIIVNPAVLRRALGGDNDVWNIVLPLFAVWAAVAALDSRHAARQVAWAAVAAAVVCVHALSWRGWLLTYAVLFTALLAHIVVRAAYLVRASRGGPEGAEPPPNPLLGKEGEERTALLTALIVCSVFYVASGALVLLTDGNDEAFRMPWNLMRIVGPAEPAPAPPSSLPSLWAKPLSTVAELSKGGLPEIAEKTFGPVVLFVSLLGMLIALLPHGRWTAVHFLCLIAGALLYGWLIADPPARTPWLTACLALPVAAALVYSVIEKRPVGTGAEIVLVIWLLAAVRQSYAGTRYIFLAAPPMGLAGAVIAGRLHQWLDQSIVPGARAAIALRLGFLLALLLALGFPLWKAHDAARSRIPDMNDAWWDTLSRLRAETPPDAIVTTWWDYGHWVTYIAERRTNADGSTLATRTLQWIARALLARDEAQAVGVIRMLNCGSDAGDDDEGKRGAYTRLRERGVDDVLAQALLARVAAVGAREAETILRTAGLDAESIPLILAATHCAPPPGYLVLSSKMGRLPGLWDMGAVRPDRAYAVQLARSSSASEAIPSLVTRLGLDEGEAHQLDAQARSIPESALRPFVAPPERYLHTRWTPCGQRASGALTCQVALARKDGSVLDSFEYNAQAPARSVFRFRDGRSVPPAALFLAGAERLETIPLAGPSRSSVAVLVDPTQRRILLGTPALLQSTLTHLLHLDGRYAKHLRKFDERSVFGERVTTWQIDWP